MRARFSYELDHEAGYWPSFVDIMTVVVLVLILVVVTGFVQAAVSLRHEIASRKAAEQAIAERTAALQASEQALAERTSILEALRRAAAERAAALQAAETALAERTSALQAMRAAMVERTAALAAAERATAELTVALQERAAVERAIKDILDRRLAVTRGLEQKLGAELVEVTSEGNISLRGDMLFLPDQAVLRDTQAVDALLTRLARSIGDILTDPQYRRSLYVILVEGHTAADGRSPDSHWRLSSERAHRIVMSLQAKDPRLLEPENARFLGAAGLAHYRPAAAGESEFAKSQNRRVEVRLVLKDEGLRDALLTALSR